MRFDNQDMDTIQLPNTNFTFSAVKPEKLGATEYTLVTIVMDKSGSLGGFENDLLEMVKKVAEACQKSPRADNILLRFVTFANRVHEEHGFIDVLTIDLKDYAAFNCNGGTALVDASYSAIEATAKYSKILLDQDYSVNSILYIITDGDDNGSVHGFNDLKKSIEDVQKSELVNSMTTILIGLNTSECGGYLETFKDSSGITHYLDMGDVTASKLGKLGGFISKSISSQSQSLQTGQQASIDLTF